MNEDEIAQHPPEDERIFRVDDPVRILSTHDDGPRGRLVEVRRLYGSIQWPSGSSTLYQLERLVLYLQPGDPRVRTELIRLREAVKALQEAAQRIYAPRDGIMPFPETRHMRMVSVPEPYVAMLNDTAARVMADMAALEQLDG